MAKAQNTAVSSGTLTTPATKRGATTLPTGSIAIIDSEVIWSVARIRPSSAAIEEPARPQNRIAASTGPSSRYSGMPSAVPSALPAPIISSAR
jgi:hypothetical protein